MPQPITTTLKIKVKDQSSAFSEYELTLLFRCNQISVDEYLEKLADAMKQTESPIASFTSISRTGNVSINFNTTLIVPENPEDLQFGNVTISGQIRPLL